MKEGEGKVKRGESKLPYWKKKDGPGRGAGGRRERGRH